METFTVKEVANYLKIHPITAARLTREGKIPGFKVGGQWRFDRAEIESWRRNQMISPSSHLLPESGK